MAPFGPRRDPIVKSTKLADVCYEIRGPVLAEANRLEEEGHRILKLNIGNPAPFGFEAPEELLRDVIHNVPASQGYCESKGLYSARKAVMQDCQRQGIAQCRRRRHHHRQRRQRTHRHEHAGPPERR